LYASPIQVVTQPLLCIGNQSFLLPSALEYCRQCCEAHLISVFYPKQELTSSSFCEQIVEESCA
jgi:hypothetical protein